MENNQQSVNAKNRIGQIENRLRATTPGRWKVAVDSYGGFNRIWDEGDRDVCCCAGDGSIPDEQVTANENFIAHAKEDIEFLLEENRRLSSLCLRTSIMVADEECDGGSGGRPHRP